MGGGKGGLVATTAAAATCKVPLLVHFKIYRPDCLSPGTCDPLIEDLLGTFRETSVETFNTALIEEINRQNLGWTAGWTSLFGESYSEVLAYRMGELPPSARETGAEGNRQDTLAFLRQVREAAGRRRSKPYVRLKKLMQEVLLEGRLLSERRGARPKKKPSVRLRKKLMQELRSPQYLSFPHHRQVSR